jgi:hypothetical protein
MPTYSIVNTQRTTGHRWEVHRPDCNHSLKFRGCTVWTVNAASPEDAIAQDLEADRRARGEDGGWSEGDYRVMPCCRA